MPVPSAALLVPSMLGVPILPIKYVYTLPDALVCCILYLYPVLDPPRSVPSVSPFCIVPLFWSRHTYTSCKHTLPHFPSLTTHLPHSPSPGLSPHIPPCPCNSYATALASHRPFHVASLSISGSSLLARCSLCISLPLRLSIVLSPSCSCSSVPDSRSSHSTP